MPTPAWDQLSAVLRLRVAAFFGVLGHHHQTGAGADLLAPAFCLSGGGGDGRASCAVPTGDRDPGGGGQPAAGGILFLSETRATPDIAILAQSAGLLMVLSFGVGAMNCLLIGLVPLWQRPWGIGMRSMFLVSGVFFTFEAVPLP